MTRTVARVSTSTIETGRTAGRARRIRMESFSRLNGIAAGPLRLDGDGRQSEPDRSPCDIRRAHVAPTPARHRAARRCGTGLDKLTGFSDSGTSRIACRSMLSALRGSNWNCRRQTLGLTPTTLRNTRVKWAWSHIPQSRATCESGSREFCMMTWAWRTRRTLT
jgi:hypothetical protein